MVRGEVLGDFSRVNSSTSKFTFKLAQAAGRQHPEGFEQAPTEVLEASVGGAPFERAGLADAMTITNAEPVELNSDL